jgi:hypothetical protein
VEKAFEGLLSGGISQAPSGPAISIKFNPVGLAAIARIMFPFRMNGSPRILLPQFWTGKLDYEPGRRLGEKPKI